MKKEIIIVIAIIIIILIGVVYMFKFNKKIEIKNLNHFVFSYDVNNMMNGDVSYKFDKKESQYFVEIKPYEVDDDDTMVIEVNKEIQAELEKILIQYEVGKWNGFKKSDKNVLDGHSFSLAARMDEDIWIEASGYMKWPKNYREVKEKLDNLFMGIYNVNKKEG